ncbi:MAG: 1-deoxy-D-xylulose-5-phosphate synthase [Candidatus Anoxychlamydiales bacterium]|uniref:1-deoxy-D-xylulose-5-phosphate synthase n=1 Tax=marine sediment metagenome TaxID=412755 RepID=A0A0F9ND30_9ZZZZ|nr:1-deoxy-D-xylulose-5-phosphate synthase [Candidatus Anoxychlamydiales bacterium]NGX40790.1 1-deoxy-D-xylulose-5-phosphate synthase [Candidatus Anoxychlamydiales bacterium]HEU64325.1 1-deoxy-D-xylulose-5-phosphate synthase [Chlamydiota bacterium]
MLEKISNPKDIKNLSIEDLDILSQEIRERIIEVLSKNGGHLGSNLGAVELSMALHFVFDSPYDKFIFDVSHQSYTHKLLTGRDKLFDTLRQFKGLCGFSHFNESIHDHFHLGHAGSAISLALGLAKNRDLLNRDEHVIPIIGDATLTNGLALEALNNIDQKTKKLIIILNDNKMSISKNVGNIKNLLSRFFSNPRSNKLYSEIETLLEKIPNIGKFLANQGKKLTQSIKNLVSPAIFFEHLNLSYIGPIDGHDIKKMIDTFEKVKNSEKPILIHVITTKGKGMEKAISNPESYHGVKPFDITTGDFLSKSKLTFPKVFGSHILDMAKKDPSIVVVNPAMLKGSSLEEFNEKFPDRCIDVGIAEGHALTYAGGIALNKNLKVLVSIYSTFLQRGLDNLFQDICLQDLPVVFAIDRAGLSGPDGPTHHGIYDIGFLNAMPNMVIVQPRDANVLKELLNSVFNWKRPVAIRYPNMEAIEVKKPLKKRKIGSFDILSKGKDILIISIGHMYKTAIDIKEILKLHDLDPTILDPIFIKPLNESLFKDLLETHKTVITIEEHSIKCGFGSIFNNFIIQNNIKDIEVMNFALPDRFLTHGGYKDLIEDLKLDAKSISEKILNFLYEETKVL